MKRHPLLLDMKFRKVHLAGFFCNSSLNVSRVQNSSVLFIHLFPQRKVFGVALESLPYYNMECGSVPRQVTRTWVYAWNVSCSPFNDTFWFCRSFLVNACMCLMAHINTEGLFRKSGSVVRLKALKVRNGLKLTLQPLKLLDPENSWQLQLRFWMSRPKWMLGRSACPPRSPVTLLGWWSSSSGSCRSLCCPQSCRKPLSRPSSFPPRRSAPQPPCCSPACCRIEMSLLCTTFSTSSTMCPRGA